MKNYKTFKRRKSDRIDAVRLHEIASAFKSRINPVLQNFFVQAEKLLTQHAQSEDYGSDVYADAADAIRTGQETVIDRINADFDQWFNWKEGERPSLAEIEKSRRASSEAEWSLMEDHSLEKSLAIERFSGRAMLGTPLDWEAFAERIRVLTADPGLQEKDLPFNAHHLGDIAFDALEQLQVPFLIQILLFRLFDDLSAPIVSEFYRDENTRLISEGILPNLKPEDLNSHRPERADTSVIQRISQSLGSGGQGGVVIDPAVLENLIHSISALQTQSNDIPDVSDLDAVKSWAAKQAQTVTQQFKGSDKSDTIALVSMLFEYFFEDGQLLPEMKHLLARMQIPIIKLAILDNGFFENNQHPARLLLNKMARAASSWQQTDELENDLLRVGMETIVARLNDEFEDDTQLFDSLLVSFDSLKSDYDEQRAQRLQNVIKHEEHALKEHESLDRISVFLNVLLDDVDLPESIEELIRNDWRRLMQFILDRQGESQNWRNSGRIVKELVWSLQPFAYTEQTERFNTIVPKMLSGFEDGLRAIGLAPEQRQSLLNIIEDTHQRLMMNTLEPSQARSNRQSTIESHLDSAEQIIQGPIPLLVDEPTIESTPADLNFYLAAIDNLNEGQWFELQTLEAIQRIQLSMIVSDGAKYVFTDNQGNKCLERSAIGLALAMRNNQIQALDDDSLVDRTLKSVAEHLPGAEI